MKMDNLSYIEIDGEQTKDLYTKVKASFSQTWIIAAYLLGLLALSFHLWHGFQSAFQTLGLNHPKYTPIIKGLGKLFSIVVPLAYAIIPIYFYLYVR
jgi:succinate dehydrogenase / fumarate reductase cytochrome b subunit